jgi:hypothetical protein
MDRARRGYVMSLLDLSAADIESLVTVTLALSDGLFVGQEVHEDDLGDAFDMLAIRGARHCRPAAARRSEVG